MSTPVSTAKPDKLDAQVLKIAGVVVLGMIMAILDVTVVAIAIPTFQDDFNASYAMVAWTMTAYTLALAIVIPITGWAADRFGTKRLYLAALTFFVLGSVLCSMAWSVESLIAFRIIQGFGGGMLMPIGMTIMTRAAGPQRIGQVMAVLGVPMLLGPIGGPILGGWLIEIASWHWIFLINLPLGIIALLYAWLVLPTDKPQPAQTFDLVGMLLLAPGLAAFLYGVSVTPEEGTIASAKVLVPALAGIALIVGFVFHALRKTNPLIHLTLFKNRQLTFAVISMTLFSIAFMGAGLLFPSYFQQVRGEETLATGLLLAPQGIGAMLTMPIAGKLADKTGAGKIVVVGLIMSALGLFTFTQLTAGTSYWLLLGSLFVMGLGLGATMMPIMTVAIQTLTDHEIARGTTLMNIVQQVAGSIGTAVMSVVLTSQMLSHPEIGTAQAAAQDEAVMGGLLQQLGPDGLENLFSTATESSASSFAATFTVALCLLVLTLIPAFFLPRKRPARPDDEQIRAEVLMH